MSEEEDDDEDEQVGDDEVRAALAALRDEDAEPELGDVLTLVRASLERERDLVPRAAQEAVMAKWETDRDYANGGADQFAWNHGVEATRAIAAAFRAVGAIENAELLDRLATALEGTHAELGARLGTDVVREFLGYRKLVNGPFFGVPEPGEELAEALVEYVIAHRAELRDP